MKRIVLLLLVPMCGCGIEGIHTANPTTLFEYGPRGVRMRDNKDNNISFDELVIDPVNKTGHLRNFKLENNASAVREVNGTVQMAGLTMQATANWAGAVNTVGALTQFAKEVLPHVKPIVAARAIQNLRAATSINTPWGGGAFGGSPEGAVDALMVIAGTQAEAPVPTTQPSTLEARLRAAQSQTEIDEIIKEIRGQP